MHIYSLYKIQIPIQVLSMFDLKMAFHGKVVIHFGPSKQSTSIDSFRIAGH